MITSDNNNSPEAIIKRELQEVTEIINELNVTPPAVLSQKHEDIEDLFYEAQQKLASLSQISKMLLEQNKESTNIKQRLTLIRLSTELKNLQEQLDSINRLRTQEGTSPQHRMRAYEVRSFAATNRYNPTSAENQRLSHKLTQGIKFDIPNKPSRRMVHQMPKTPPTSNQELFLPPLDQRYNKQKKERGPKG